MIDGSAIEAAFAALDVGGDEDGGPIDPDAILAVLDAVPIANANADADAEVAGAAGPSAAEIEDGFAALAPAADGPDGNGPNGQNGNGNADEGDAGNSDDSEDADGLRKRYRGLAKAWDKVKGLRWGERAAEIDDDGRRRRCDGRRAKVHKNKWGFENVLQVAYQCIGREHAATREGEVGSTKRSMDALAGASALIQDTLGAERDRQLSSFGASASFVSSVINRYSDSTPLRCAFGQLAPILQQRARYLWRDPNAPPGPTRRWRLVDLETLRTFKGYRIKPKYGVVDICAHLATVHLRSEGPGASGIVERTLR